MVALARTSARPGMPLPLLGLAAAAWFRCHLVWLFLPVRTRGTVFLV